MPPRIVRAAGGVVYRSGYPDTGPQFLVVHRNRYHDWSLPKGKIDRGETFEEAALREVAEETGLKCKTEDYLGGVTYPTQRDRPKLVRYWLMRVTAGNFLPNLEVDKVEWVGINGALSLLTYNRDARLVERAAAILQNRTSTRLYVVRHGNAGVRSKWKGPDKKRPLTGKGREQASVVADLLARHPVTEIISSKAVRCIQTVEPLAASLEVEIATAGRLNDDATIDDIRQYLKDFKTGSVVLSTHREWIEPLIRDADKRKVPLRGTRRWPKASIWVFDLADGKVGAGYYAGRGLAQPVGGVVR
ncbi:MAG: NUDIX hydrolase [Acidimicrobiia bacterium]|nr:NUDIX hydrolase [Acidimicrobiia bacterium]